MKRVIELLKSKFDINAAGYMFNWRQTCEIMVLLLKSI